MKNLIHYIAGGLVADPDSLEINEISGNQTTVIELKVKADELGKVIGRQGRTAKALRTLVNAAALKNGKRVILEIIENRNT